MIIEEYILSLLCSAYFNKNKTKQSDYTDGDETKLFNVTKLCALIFPVQGNTGRWYTKRGHKEVAEASGGSDAGQALRDKLNRGKASNLFVWLCCWKFLYNYLNLFRQPLNLFHHCKPVKIILSHIADKRCMSILL